jgi:hypothetical protein
MPRRFETAETPQSTRTEYTESISAAGNPENLSRIRNEQVWRTGHAFNPLIEASSDTRIVNMENEHRGTMSDITNKHAEDTDDDWIARMYAKKVEKLVAQHDAELTALGGHLKQLYDRYAQHPNFNLSSFEQRQDNEVQSLRLCQGREMIWYTNTYDQEIKAYKDLDPTMLAQHRQEFHRQEITELALRQQEEMQKLRKEIREGI